MKKDARTKYAKQYKEEEKKESTKHNDERRAKRNAITEQFLNSFFLPLRRKYEEDIDWYKERFPIKEEDLEEKPANIDHIFAYGEVLASKKVWWKSEIK